MNKKERENNIYLGIRAREAVTRCLFVPRQQCREWCANHDEDGGCGLFESIGNCTDPREWYASAMAEVAAS